MILTLVFAAALQPVPITDQQRIATKQAVERARYQFVIGNKPPFDRAYPRSVFVRQVKEEHVREEILRRAFGVVITSEMLANEYDRIEKNTKAPEQWNVMKAAAKNDRRLIEEGTCRPLLVDRAIHAKFDFDQGIHARAHDEARLARAAFLRGETPHGAKEVALDRRAPDAESTDDMLRKAQGNAGTSAVTESAQPEPSRPVAIDPEASNVLDKLLRKPGDVSTVLEYRDRFEIYRLIGADAATWHVQRVVFPKETFDEWYSRTRERLSDHR